MLTTKLKKTELYELIAHLTKTLVDLEWQLDNDDLTLTDTTEENETLKGLVLSTENELAEVTEDRDRLSDDNADLLAEVNNLQALVDGLKSPAPTEREAVLEKLQVESEDMAKRLSAENGYLQDEIERLNRIIHEKEYSIKLLRQEVQSLEMDLPKDKERTASLQ